MTLTRIDWPTVAARGAVAGRAVLIAGLPDVIVCEGQEITAVTWTGDADPAWHVGTSPTSVAWLLAPGGPTSEGGHDPPPLAWEEHASPVQGTVDVGSLRLWLADAEDTPTLTFGSRDALPFTRLAGDLTASGTTVTVESTDALPSSGYVHLGRERIEYAGKTSTTLTGCTRGTAGTKARPYSAGGTGPGEYRQAHRVYGPPAGGGEALPSLAGRRVTVWIYEIDGTTALDPTLIYDGRVVAGAGTVDTSAWELVVEHAIKGLETETQAPTITLSGYSHGTVRRTTDARPLTPTLDAPLVAWWIAPGGGSARQLTLNSDAAAPDNGGWSATREQYLQRWNRAAVDGGFNIAAAIRSDGILQVTATDGATDRRLTVWWGWNEQTRADPSDEGDVRDNATVYSIGAGQGMPEACYWLDGRVYLGASDMALIPSVPSNPVHGDVYAWWTLRAQRDNNIAEKGSVTASITAVTSGSPGYITVQPVEIEGSAPGAGRLGMLFNRVTQGTVGLFANGPMWWDVLRYGVFEQLDLWRGTDQIADSIEWSRIAEIARQHAALPARREYVADLGKPMAEMLRNEARLSGLALTAWWGRVSMVFIGEAAPTEARAASLTSEHLRAGEVATCTESSDGLATSYKLTLPSGDTITVQDAGAIAESGSGAAIEATLPAGVLPPGAGIGTPALHAAVIDVGSAVLAPWVRPYRVVSWPGDLRLAGLQLGDVVELEEWMLPDASGGRGLAGVAGTVIGRHVDLDAGTVDLKLRLSPTTIAGYAPEALVASISSSVLTLGTISVGTITAGGEGFAGPNDDGSTRTDAGASWFTAGDAIYLLEIDTNAPATPFRANVLSVSGYTVTLDASPGGSWASAATAGRVLLCFDSYADATAAQHRFAFIADRATFQLPGGATARRWV